MGNKKTQAQTFATNLSQSHIGPIDRLFELARHVETDAKGAFSIDPSDHYEPGVVMVTPHHATGLLDDSLYEDGEPFYEAVQLATVTSSGDVVSFNVVESTEEGALTLLSKAVAIIR